MPTRGDIRPAEKKGGRKSIYVFCDGCGECRWVLLKSSHQGTISKCRECAKKILGALAYQKQQ